MKLLGLGWCTVFPAREEVKDLAVFQLSVERIRSLVRPSVKVLLAPFRRGSIFSVESMRVTIEIAAKDLKEIQRITARKKKSPAISQALSEFLCLRQKREFVERALAGQTDYPLTNDELEDRDLYEAR